jgi:hypothetical protein
MTRQGFIRTVCILLLALFLACDEKPVAVDGRSSITVVAKMDTSSDATVQSIVPARNAQVIFTSEYGVRTRIADALGRTIVTNMPASVYAISVRAPHPIDPAIFFVASKENIDLVASPAVAETLFLQPISASGLVINEIYTPGPVNNIFYFYDQFIELYNASNDVKYLDGLQVSRVSGNNEAGQHGPGYDERGDGQIQGVTYIFQFPGRPGGHQYPVQPRQFVVLAASAIDHRRMVSTSIDLSRADWEFYNQYSATDVDNPSVPNLLNQRSDRTVEFLINLVSDVIVVSSGADSVWQDGLRIDTILDAVEYHSSVTVRKTLDSRCDRSFALSPPRYSGQSMRRRSPGMDSNNSRFDFEITTVCTPGKH